MIPQYIVPSSLAISDNTLISSPDPKLNKGALNNPWLVKTCNNVYMNQEFDFLYSVHLQLSPN